MRKYFDKIFNGEQGNIVRDTTITLLDENRESMQKNTKKRGGCYIQLRNEDKESCWASCYTYCGTEIPRDNWNVLAN